MASTMNNLTTWLSVFVFVFVQLGFFATILLATTTSGMKQQSIVKQLSLVKQKAIGIYQIKLGQGFIKWKAFGASYYPRFSNIDMVRSNVK